jgi:hypothetical protein
MRVILFTTTNMQGGRSSQIERMVNSVAAQLSDSFEIQIHMLLQNAKSIDVERIRQWAPSFCRIKAIPNQVPLSAARNMLLSQVVRYDQLGDADVVGFPDDDCWLPAPFLSNLVEVFSAHRDVDFFVCGLSLQPEPSRFHVEALRDARASRVVRVGSSNNIFLRGTLVGSLGAFDTTLGLGTPNHGGEDTDYAVRAFLQARSTKFVEAPLVGHQSSDLASAAKYFQGALIVLARYALQHRDLAKEFSRKFLVGIYLVLRGKLTPSRYLGAAIAGMRVFRATRSQSTPLEAPLPQPEG